MPTDKTNSQGSTTHFGYREIPVEEKVGAVGQVFDSVASHYDIMNDLMSLGIHRLWKRFTIEATGVRKGHCVLDLAGGTGDISRLLAPHVGEKGKIILADINASMLSVGRDRLLNEGLLQPISYVQANAEELPFADNTFDLVTMAFGLRNVTDKERALKSITRTLKPGGRLVVLEFSKPQIALLAKIYDTYSFSILPKLGQFIANDADSYQYLAESIRMHPNQQELLNMFKEAGLTNTDYLNMTGGIVAVHRGIKA